jgi:putative ABC transport system substrate-binding protein
LFYVRHAGGRTEQLPALTNELLALKVDVIVAVNTPAAQAAKNATRATPIVIMRTADPVRTGLVSNITRPGGNITGVSFAPEEVSGKRLELLKEMSPRLARVAVLYSSNPGASLVVDDMEQAAARLGLTLQRLPLRSPADFTAASEAVIRADAGALVLVDDAMITSQKAEILALGRKRSLPVVSIFPHFAEAGGLIAYGPNGPHMYKRAAQYVDSILKGAKPADLPIEQPSRYDLTINVRTAKALGLSVPPSLLLRANRIIE